LQAIEVFDRQAADPILRSAVPDVREQSQSLVNQLLDLRLAGRRRVGALGVAVVSLLDLPAGAKAAGETI
jgi:hypothetical protein